MDKAEEIFAEGIEDRNVKTIRQARVLFVICLMAGMFIIFESDDIFKWITVLAVYFFTDSFYKKYLRVEANLICTPFTGHPVKGVFLCVTVTNSNERQSNYTGKENGLNHQQTSQT